MWPNMKITDKIGTDAVKTLEDSYIGASSDELLHAKMDAFDNSGLDSLISGADSLFNSIKGLIGSYIGKFTNSLEVVKDNKDQFFSNIDGLEGRPEDLK